MSAVLPRVTREHCAACFAALEAHLAGREAPRVLRDEGRAGVFVTWTTTRDDRLRGCIGSLAEIDVARGLVDFALRAARDSRFEAVAWEELPSLSCGVSLLSRFEDAANWSDWEVGVHGIIARVVMRGSSYSATYLPEVAPEQGWDQRKAVQSLLAKAGVERRLITDALLPSVKLTRYTSSKCKVTYADWRAMAAPADAARVA